MEVLMRRRRLVAGLVGLALAGATLTGTAGADERLVAYAQRAAGQRVVYSYPGLTPPESLLARIRAGEAAGVIFFGENIASRAQISGVVGQLRAAAAQSPDPYPLLLMTDQEGGLVRRLPGEPALSHKDIGQSADPGSAATAAGRGAGQNLAGVGMNVNLAPVLDVFHAPGDLMDSYERSFSGTASVAGTLGADYVTAEQAVGVAATVKHFPGLGKANADENTDTRPVTLNVPLSTLRGVDEAPYQRAIAAGAKLVMLSWAVYPALDAGRPAGLSATVVRELRSRTGFTGVTCTDALEAGALRDYGSTGDRAVLAAQAGDDLVLASARDVSQGAAAADALAGALTDGTLDSGAFGEALARVNALRASLG
ncbi:glycoside hydrolase family 3 N-terminal domain-containing protein [Actinophytocola sp.]|uniref:glycoside hydrolase family 3 N-terminal domain-containing protein n=1 Tax=Actinophytocola sp. TaxID=1872138 RepID=UPI002D6A08A5|nr:glycoside hydrolase family 3 N-terminal domain-containing protein [Actinophytocola sp.]HYQ63430.1 glycoside hydrolase family 3 N-terminal domain-containing protein [Actinophytocola sp.]